jgi:nucleoside-diphosphate-sugar epimerase
VRDDVYVGDVAEAIHHAIAKSANGTFNIASGHPHTLWEIAEVIGRLTKPPLIPRSANIPGTIWVDRWFSTDRARRILECPEPTPFEKGVATMWDEMSR